MKGRVSSILSMLSHMSRVLAAAQRWSATSTGLQWIFCTLQSEMIKDESRRGYSDEWETRDERKSSERRLKLMSSSSMSQPRDWQNSAFSWAVSKLKIQTVMIKSLPARLKRFNRFSESKKLPPKAASSRQQWDKSSCNYWLQSTGAIQTSTMVFGSLKFKSLADRPRRLLKERSRISKMKAMNDTTHKLWAFWAALKLLLAAHDQPTRFSHPDWLVSNFSEGGNRMIKAVTGKIEPFQIGKRVKYPRKLFEFIIPNTIVAQIWYWGWASMNLF